MSHKIVVVIIVVVVLLLLVVVVAVVILSSTYQVPVGSVRTQASTALDKRVCPYTSRFYETKHPTTALSTKL